MKASRAAILVLAVSRIGSAALGFEAQSGASPGTKPADDALAPWRSGVTVRPASGAKQCHTIHAYFNTSPESPDSRWVLFYASVTAEAHEGELRILERATGRERVIARSVTIEDAHRAACQQWVSKGRRVVFHDVREGQWLVAAVDVENGKERILVRDRQVGWGQANADVVPVYGCHWNPGEHRDLELIDVETGMARTVVTASAVKAAYAQWIAKQFAQREVSVFFPVLSPDLHRVFFKMASPAGGDFRSRKASLREGLLCYELTQARFLFLREKWGHPAWHPDSRTIIEPGNVLIQSDTGTIKRIPGLPVFRGSHPSISPDGRLFVTDAMFSDGKGEYGIVVGRLEGGDYVVIHRFDNSQGARSWRRSHPHPIFSPDGKRIYFNVSSGPWTELHVAEARRSA